MTVNTYDIGDLVRISAAFVNDGGVATDPASGAVIAKYKDPSGNTTTLTYPADVALVKDSTGNYHVDILVDEFGDWHYRFAGTSVVVAADEHRFYVEKSVF